MSQGSNGAYSHMLEGRVADLVEQRNRLLEDVKKRDDAIAAWVRFAFACDEGRTYRVRSTAKKTACEYTLNAWDQEEDDDNA